MPEESPYTPPSDSSTTPRPRRLRRWFIAGFAIVFVGMLLFLNQYFYTGGALVQCKLWRFYLLEIQRAFTSSGALGPTSASGMQALMMFITHVGISCVGGLLALGVGAIVRRFRG